MTGTQAITFAMAAAVLTMLPGPDTLLVLRTALVHGRRAALLVTTGICAGLFVHASVSALGVATLLAHSPRAFGAFQSTGATYLGFLGLRSLYAALARDLAPLAIAGTGEAKEGSSPGLLFSGFLCNVLNPKAMLFYAALLPQFLRPTDPVFLTSLALTSIHWAEGMAWLAFLTFSLDRIRHRLLGSSALRLFEGLTGLLLTGLAVRMALERLG